MQFIKQTKATDHKPSQTQEPLYHGSIKYDGYYIQIHKKDNNIVAYSSNGKLLTPCPALVTDIQKIPFNVVLEGEYLGDTLGELGDRDRVSFKNELTGKIIIFDIINKDPFKERLKIINNLAVLPLKRLTITQHKPMTIKEAQSSIYDGLEGYILKSPTHLQNKGKTSKSLKIKGIYTADVKIISIDKEELTVKCADENGISCTFNIAEYLLDILTPSLVVEVQYERIKKAYVSARFLRIRDDKTID